MWFEDALTDILKAGRDKYGFVSWYVGDGGLELFAECISVEDATYQQYCKVNGNTVDEQIEWDKKEYGEAFLLKGFSE